MSEYLKRATGRVKGLREDFRKLPRARKTALLLAAGAAASVSILPFLGSRPGALPETSAEGPDTGPGARAASFAGTEPDPAPAPPSLWETPRQVEERSRDHNRRRVELAIEQNPRISKASLVLSRAPSSRSALQKGPDDSAALTITLAAGVRELARSEADSIRSIVECAFGLRPERVSIADNFHRSYNDTGASLSSSRLHEAQEACRLALKHAVEEQYARVFAREDFIVSAIVRLSAEHSSVEKFAVDASRSMTLPVSSRFEREEGSDPGAVEGGLMAPPAGALRRVVRETTEEKPFVSQEKTTTEKPPGEVQGVSLTALFDIEAVESVIARDAHPGGRAARAGADPAGLSHALWQASERSLAIAAFVSKEEEALRTLLRGLRSLAEPEVMVLVHPFVKDVAPVDSPEIPATSLAAAPLTAEGSSPAGTWALAALVGASAIAAGFLVARRSSLALRRAPASSPVHPERAAGTTTPGEDVLRTVTRTNGAVRENPEAAASVLRYWLSQDAAETLGGQARS